MTNYNERFVSASTRGEAVSACPWATIIEPAEFGFWCFRSTYEWKRFHVNVELTKLAAAHNTTVEFARSHRFAILLNLAKS